MKRLLILCLLLTSCVPSMNLDKLVSYDPKMTVDQANLHDVAILADKFCRESGGGRLNRMVVKEITAVYPSDADLKYFGIYACDKDNISNNPKADPNYKPEPVQTFVNMSDGSEFGLLNFTAFIGMF